MDEWDFMLEPLRATVAAAVAMLPRLLFALVIVVAGWLVAKAVRLAAVKMLRAMNLQVLAERAGTDEMLQQGGARIDTVGVIGLLAYWATLLAALVLAFNGLELAYVTDLLARAALFVLRLIVAVVIVACGAYFARFIGVKTAAGARAADVADAELLGQLARYGVLAFVVLIALDQVDIAGSLIRESFLILLAGVVFALALAFGLGGRHRAAALLERWWTRRREP
ncbi:MAG: mechanosensitive ion channel family protein [Ignavibacteria bacterium]